MIQVIQIPTPPTPPLPPEFVFQSGPPQAVMVAVTVIVIVLVAGAVLRPLIRALARRVEGQVIDQGLQNEVGQLRARVAELEELHARLGELEERVDFSERLLTRGQVQPAERKGA